MKDLNGKQLIPGNLSQKNFKDFRSAVNESQRPKRQKNPGYYQNGINIPCRARFKLRVFFLDGNKRSFYSYDFGQHIKQGDNTIKPLDEWLGLSKLLGLVNNYHGKYKTAIIYATTAIKPTTGKSNYNVMCAKYTQFQNVLNPTIHFYQSGHHNMLNLKRIDPDYFSSKIIIK